MLCCLNNFIADMIAMFYNHKCDRCLGMHRENRPQNLYRNKHKQVKDIRTRIQESIQIKLACSSSRRHQFKVKEYFEFIIKYQRTYIHHRLLVLPQ